MSERAYIISPGADRTETLGLMPGEHWFEARLSKGTPLVAVHTAVIVPMEDGEVVGDVRYLVEIKGEEVPFEKWEHMTLIGDEITREAYNYRLAAFAWDRDNLGLDEKTPVDLGALPPVMPPARAETADLMADIEKMNAMRMKVTGADIAIIGIDRARPGGDKAVTVHGRKAPDGVIIIDDIIVEE